MHGAVFLLQEIQGSLHIEGAHCLDVLNNEKNIYK